MSVRYWNNRYKTNETGWDIGHISKPIKEYIDQLKDKNLKILIPGAGNSYEAEYIFNQGFKHIYVADISKIPLQNLKNRVSDFPESQLVNKDFFELKGKYDLILEQTFFCAITPELREAYVKKMHELLKPNGRLVGLLFDFPLTEEGPPFGGSKSEYKSLFKKRFKILKLETANNSIPQRAGKELFFQVEKK
jgi:SAM-dependent methyltransferase